MYKEYTLKNGIKLIYKQTTSALSSICISLDAGAGRDGDKFGVAHATEHMLYKGTKNRTEAEVNEALSSIFGFQNAMTNYPYVIYYGTLLSEDLEKALELFSDILINPTFDEDGFKEEMEIIKEELMEWDEDIDQFCEDKLFLNTFDNRRIKYPIIGTTESLNKLTINCIKEFYIKHYFPKNTSIAITSNIEFHKVIAIVMSIFEGWENNQETLSEPIYENPRFKVFNDRKEGTNTCKVQIVFPIHDLDYKEIRALRIFNQYFGEGVNSILFDTLRTKNSLVYDVLTNVSAESFIKLYKITYSTSKDSVDKSIALVKEIIMDVNNILEKMDLKVLAKSFKLKRLFAEEQSVRLAKELSTSSSMYGSHKVYIDETEMLNDIIFEDILRTASKVFESYSIEIISG